MDTFHGKQIIQSAYLTETMTVTVRRTWWQRCTERPFRPWVTYATTSRTVPSNTIYVMPWGVMMHPAKYQALKDQKE